MRRSSTVHGATIGSAAVCKLLARAMDWAVEARDTICLLIVEIRSADGACAMAGSAPSDIVLNLMGDRLVAAIGPLDTVLRLSVDRFAMILVSTGDANRSAHVADKVLRAVGEFPSRGGRRLTASIGAACSTLGGSEPSRLVLMAEVALRQARDAGRNLLFAGSIPPLVRDPFLLPG